jgi:hypothetical protein
MQAGCFNMMVSRYDAKRVSICYNLIPPEHKLMLPHPTKGHLVEALSAQGMSLMAELLGGPEADAIRKHLRDGQVRETERAALLREIDENHARMPKRIPMPRSSFEVLRRKCQRALAEKQRQANRRMRI